MSSIFSSGSAPAGASPFTTTGMAPSPGGMTATRMQSASKPGAASQATPQATASSSAAAGSISSNDFLTLLVTEMQNQDPTAQTDPNQYVNQLVQINSLEQLISINQSLSGLSPVTTPPTGKSVPSPANHGSTPSLAATSAPNGTKGNLSIPSETPAAHAVAHALNHPAQPGPSGHAVASHAVRDIPNR